MTAESGSSPRVELARRIVTASLLEGEFVLRSGRTSTRYLDKYRFESDPELLAAIVAALSDLLPPAFDRLAGMELGGVPLATALSLRTGKPCLYVRKTAKTYGTCNLVEGGYAPGDEIVLIEDVITTAGQVCQSAAEIRKLGLVVRHVVCVVDREAGGREALTAVGCSLSALFNAGELGF